MNKTVSIPQPYAEALCSNACDVLHLDVAPEELPCRCIIRATRPVFNPQTPLEWIMAIHNEQVYGTFGATDTLPVDVPIGYVDVVEKVPYDYNIWSLGLPEPVFRVENAHLFDEPSPLLPNREDLPLDKWLPSHVVKRSYPYVGMMFISLDVNPDIFNLAAHRGTFLVDLTHEFDDLCITEDGLIDGKYDAFLTCGNLEKRFDNAVSEIFYELDRKGDLVTYPSLLHQGKLMPRRSLLIKCFKQWGH